jgi:hypothetical protein
MAIQENEQLFLDLIVFDGLTDQRIKELIEAGYLDEEKENTDKAEAFIAEFVSARKDEIIDTLNEQGSYFKDKGHVMYHAGIKNLMAMEVVMEHLAHNMVIKRKRDGDYIARTGKNHC